jgi:hypothetical protein
METDWTHDKKLNFFPPPEQFGLKEEPIDQKK